MRSAVERSDVFRPTVAFLTGCSIVDTSLLAVVRLFPLFCGVRCEELSLALGTRDSAPLPKQNVFAVQNYHKARSAQDPGELKG